MLFIIAQIIGFAGMFFNIKLETGKTELIRAVVEGICFHMRWMLERQDMKKEVTTGLQCKRNKGRPQSM